MKYLRELHENEDGALSAEYVGVLVLVGGLVFAITQLNIASTLTSQVSSALSQMFSGSGG